MTSSNVYFISFGGPSNEYHNTLKRICGEAQKFAIFTKILGFTEIYLKNDVEFWNTHGRFIESNPRGYGYWLWKSYLVKNQLRSMNEGDVLIYADAGCTLNINGKARLIEYIDMCKNHESGIVSFQLPHIEHNWTKNDIIQHLNASNEIILSGHLVGTVFLIRKCRHAIELVDKWYETCCFYNLLNDSPSLTPNHPTFVENRHDQSIWSILRKQYGSVILSDETYFTNWNVEGIDYPFWATRKRH
jgi:hypothetical protein